jgi:hypothetical protein
MSSTPSTNELVIFGAPVALRDGLHVRVRQVQRSDKELLLRGFERPRVPLQALPCADAEAD